MAGDVNRGWCTPMAAQCAYVYAIGDADSVACGSRLGAPTGVIRVAGRAARAVCSSHDARRADHARHANVEQSSSHL